VTDGRRRGGFGGQFIVVGAFIMALIGTFLGISLFGNRGNGDGQVQIVTVAVIITATQDPNATLPVIIISATPDRTQVAIPTSVAQAVDGLTIIPPTIDATQLAANPNLEQTQISLPQNCILHTVASGDTPFGIASQYGSDGFALMEANGLTDETAALLQIGDVLVVPLQGCPLDQLPNFRPASLVVEDTTSDTSTDATPSDEATNEATAEATEDALRPTATITLAPTATNAQVSIITVEKAGDVTAEGVRIRNNSNTVNVTGWTLSDAQGNTYTFGEQLIFSNTEITVFTRAGQNTPIALFWGRDTAVWGDNGDVVTLKNKDGVVQATTRLSSVINLGN
jgi:hypothetical protein